MSKSRVRNFHYLTKSSDLDQGDVEDLRAMQDEAREIKWRTLISRHVSVQEIDEIFWWYDKRSLHLKNDPHVRFYQSRFRGERCYVIEHSGIEYIFTRRNNA